MGMLKALGIWGVSWAICCPCVWGIVGGIEATWYVDCPGGIPKGKEGTGTDGGGVGEAELMAAYC